MATSNVAKWLREQQRDEVLNHGFYHFCVVTRTLPDICEQPHKEMCAEMEAMEPDFLTKRPRQLRKLYLAPRYTYKTSLLEAFVLYLILRHPNIAIVIFRASREMAMTVLYNIKTLMVTNEVLLEVFGNISTGASKWTETQVIVNTRTRANRDATITVAGIDVTTTGMHPDVVFLDDIVTRENCDSPKLMMDARELLQSIYPLLPPWGTMLVTGTRWSNLDAYAWIQDRNRVALDAGKEPAYKEYIRAAWVRNLDTGKEELFFPAKLNEEFLERAREDLTPRYFASWYYNQTYEAGMKPFPDLQFFDGEYFSGPYKYVQLDDRAFASEQVPLYMAMIVDPALTASGSSDSFGVIVVGFDANGDWLIFEGDEIRKLPSDACDDLITHLLRYEVDMLVIESANADVSMVARLQDAIRDAKLSTMVVSYSALQDEKRGERGKAQRIGALEPLFRQHKVWIRRGACRALVHQLDMYPGVEHDDVLDALAMARKAFSLAPVPDGTSKDNGLEQPDAWHTAVGWRHPNEKPSEQTKGGWVGPGTLGF